MQHALRLGKGSRLFHVGGRRHQEDLGADVLGLKLAVFNLRRILPEGGGLNLLEIAYDQPLQRRQATALHTAIGLRDGRVLAKDKVAFHLLIQHGHERFIGRMRTRNARHEVISPSVVLGCRIAPVGLHQRDRVVLTDLPKALLRLITDSINELWPALLIDARHGQIPRQRVEQRRDIGRALNRGVTAQRHNARTWATHIAGEQLQDGRGTDELRTQGVLGEAQGIGKAGSALRRRVLRDRLR